MFCSHVPSRLEGIETQSICARRRGLGVVHMCLPVWRELKLFGCVSVCLYAGDVHMCLPVWRELKLFFCCVGGVGWVGSHVPSRLEGIETFIGVIATILLFLCSHVPSRLEGIETVSVISSMSASSSFTCAFPFGGN